MNKTTENLQEKSKETEIASYLSEQTVNKTIDKDPLKVVPVFLHNLVVENENSVDFEDEDENSILVEVKKDGLKYPLTMSFFEDHNPEKYQGTVEWVVNNTEIYKLLQERLNGDLLEEVNQRINKIQQDVEAFIIQNGFEWEMKVKMSMPFYAWWNIVFTKENWDEDKFVACWKAADKGSQMIEDILQEFFVV